MTFPDALNRLEAALRTDLPGAAAHALMAPRPRRAWPPGFSIERIRHAAGLLLVFPLDEQPHIVLTVRSDTLDRHGGQVSLPGGVVEPGETYEEAALREAHEEIGLSTVGLRRLGLLSPIDIPVSGFRLHPVVARSQQAPRSAGRSDGEVARIVEPPLAHLMDTERIGWRIDDPRDNDFRVSCLSCRRRRDLGSHRHGAGRVPLDARLAGTRFAPILKACRSRTNAIATAVRFIQSIVKN